MEPQEPAKYSKPFELDKVEQVLKDEELEETEKLMEQHMQSSSSSEDEDSTDEIEVAFGARRPGDL